MEDFDPSRAVPVSESFSASVGSLNPTQEPQVFSLDRPKEEFDPTRAIPQDDYVAQEATKHLSEYQTGKYGELDPKEVYTLNLAAQRGRPFGQRFLDKLTGGDYTQAAKDVGSGIYNTFADYATQQAGLIGKSFKDLKSGDIASLYDDYSKAKQEQLNATAGAAKGVLGLAPAALEVGSAGLQALEGVLPVSPQSEQQFDALLNTGTDIVRHGVEVGTDKLAQLAGADTETPEGKIAANVAPLGVPIAGGEALAGDIESAAKGIVSGIDKTASRIREPLGKAISATAPITANVAARAPEAAAGALIGEGFGHAGWGALAGSFIKPQRLEEAIGKAIKAKGEDLAEASRAIINSPYGTAPIDAVQGGLRAKLDNLQQAMDFGKSKLKPEELSDLDQAVVNPEIARHLKGVAKNVFEQNQEASQLADKINIIEKNKGFALFQRQASEMLVRKGLQTAEGAAVLGGLAGASSPPGDTQAVPRGVISGAALGAAGSLVGVPLEVRAAIREHGRMNLAASGKTNITKDNPLYNLHQEGKDSLSEPWQDYVDINNGIAKGSGGKVIVLKGEDYQKVGGDTAGVFHPESNTAFINSDKIGQGPVPHEITHSIDQVTGLSKPGTPYGDALAELFASDDPEVKDALSKAKSDYEKRLNSDLGEDEKPITLDDEGLKSEITADLGSDIFREHDAEGLYGGKSILQNLESKIKAFIVKSEPTTGIFNFPVTENMRSALTDELFKAGERAKTTAKSPAETSGATEGVKTATPESKAATEASAAPETPISGPFEKGLKKSEGKLAKIGEEPIKQEDFWTPRLERASQAALDKAIEAGEVKLNNKGEPTNKSAKAFADKWLQENVRGKEPIFRAIKQLKDSGDKFKLTFETTGGETRAFDQAQFGVAPKGKEGKEPKLSNDPNVYKFYDADTKGYRSFHIDRVKSIEGPGVKFDRPVERGQKFMPSQEPKSGKPYEFNYIRNTSRAPREGDRFGQNIEPAGRYINEAPGDNLPKGVISGKARFENPLVIPEGGGYGEESNWKSVLSKQFGGKTGKSLSRSILKEGHDGIITTGKYGTGEIVDLRNFGRPEINNTSFMPSSDPRAIKEPAWKLDDGRIISKNVPSHSLIKMPQGYYGDAIPGFIDNQGHFIGRDQAYERAKELRQIDEKYDQKAEDIFKGPVGSQLEGQAFFGARRDWKAMPYVERAQKSAEDYVRKSGIGKILPPSTARADVENARQIARDYIDLPKVDNSPETKKSYSDFVDEVNSQYQHAVDSGIKFEFTTSDPYKNSADMMKDVENGKLKVYTGGGEHPFLGESTKDENGLTANDKFRAVHDLYGHASEGNQFGPIGEERAFRKHSAMFSDSAKRAMTSETRGQNSFVNYGPHMFDENGYKGDKSHPDYIPPQDRPFAEQKAALLPEEYSKFMPSDTGKYEGKTTKQERVRAEAGRLGLQHVGGEGDTTTLLDPVTKIPFTVTDKTEPGEIQARLKSIRLAHLGGDKMEFMPSDDPRAIKQPAIRMPDGQIFASVFHAAATGKAEMAAARERDPVKRMAMLKSLAHQEYTDGFITNVLDKDGNPEFLDRKEAYQRAEETKQIEASGAEQAYGGGQLESTRLDESPAKDRFMPAGPNIDSEPWVHRYFQLDQKEQKYGLTPDETKEMDQLHQQAVKEYGRYDKFYLAHGGKQYNAKNLFQFMPSPHPEAIKSAAVRFENGKIYTGVVHGDAWEKAYKDMGNDMHGLKGKPGFVNNSGKFLDVHDALDAAERVKQINHKEYQDSLNELNLENYEGEMGLESYAFGDTRKFMPSEDLWGDTHKYLTPEERASVRDNQIPKVLNILQSLTSVEKGVKSALAGKDKKTWYQDSAKTISHVFGPDADRFAAVLGALSPQVGVEQNLKNALNTWANWLDAGRPTGEMAIDQILAMSVSGEKGEQSVLGAWRNNVVRALTTDDPSTKNLKLSGPKVDSFYNNLRNNLNEITNDSWMSVYGFGEKKKYSNRKTTNPYTKKRTEVKGLDYIALNAHVRQVADYLTKTTGEEWAPAEAQAAIWSHIKGTTEKTDIQDVVSFDKLLNNPEEQLTTPELRKIADAIQVKKFGRRKTENPF